MKTADLIKSLTSHVVAAYKDGPNYEESYPQDILDLVIFHKIHFYIEESEALACYRKLKSYFVDWNEVRISSVREIQETLGNSADTPEIAIFIKGLLEFLHRERHAVCMEFLGDENITEIRRFLKRINGLDSTTINMILRVHKDYPILPVTPSMESTLVRLGLVRRTHTRDQKARFLHGVIREELAIPFHHFILNHSREICPPDEERVQCSACDLRDSCNYYRLKDRRPGTRKKR